MVWRVVASAWCFQFCFLVNVVTLHFNRRYEASTQTQRKNSDTWTKQWNNIEHVEVASSRLFWHYVRSVFGCLCCDLAFSETPFTRYNRLFDNRLYCVKKHSTGCQTGLTMFDNRVERTTLFVQPVVKPVERTTLFVQPVVKPGCTTILTTGCIHDAAVCQTGLTTSLTTGLTTDCIVYTNILPCCQTGLTTGCIV